MARKTNVTINGIDYYRIRKTIGRDKNGEPIIKPFYGTSKSDAEAKYLQWRDERVKGLTIDSNKSLTQAMYIWLWKILKPTGIKSTTFERYEVTYRLHIDGSDLGYTPLGKIDKLAIQDHYATMHADGKSYNQILSCHKRLNQFFRYCLSEGFVVKNPCFGIKFDAYDVDNDELVIDEEIKDEGTIETFTEDEIKLLVNDNHKNKKLRILIKFAVGTGLRQGEILALNIKDVDLDRMTVKVTKTLVYVKIFDNDGNYHYEHRRTKPKTKSSVREISIPSGLKKDLQELNRIRLEEKMKLGSAYNDNELLFPSELGNYMDAKNLTRAWKRTLENLGVSYKRFHCLRHTFATQLLNRGEDITVVSRLLGHSSIKTTERYVHILQDTKVDAVQKLNALF